ncbi:MAG: hypothetical protein R2857_11780 [Vampirovibrionales bacterium]
MAGLLSLSGWASAFLAEVIWGGTKVEDGHIAGSPRAGPEQPATHHGHPDAPGLLRYVSILANTFMNLAKNTSIIYFVGVLEMTYAFEQLSARYFSVFPVLPWPCCLYGPVPGHYLCL